MAFTREQKQKTVEELKEKVIRQKAMVFVDFAGLKTSDLLKLKQKLTEADSLFRVCKKTLLNVALKESGTPLDIKDLVKGQVAVVFGFKDEIRPAKTVYQFSQENKSLKILGGFIENKFQDKEYVIALAQLPSQEEIWARFVGTVSAPISNFVRVLQANIKGLIFALRAINSK